MRRSQAIAISAPPPTHEPVMNAITGFGNIVECVVGGAVGDEEGVVVDGPEGGDVGAGAEVLSGAAHDENTHCRITGEGRAVVRHRPPHVDRHGVALVGAVEPQGRDRATAGDLDVHRRHRTANAACWPRSTGTSECPAAGRHRYGSTR